VLRYCYPPSKSLRSYLVSKWIHEKKLILEAALKMLEKGMVAGTSGNISLRLSPEHGPELLAITPTSRYYDLLTPDDIPVIDFKARPIEGKLQPSSESFLHIDIYRARDDVGAIIHTHSVYASAMAAARLAIPPILDEQLAILGGKVDLAKYAPSGTRELARKAVAALKDRNAVLLMNHGLVGVGKDLREAFTVCEVVEKAAQVFYLCSTMGRVNPLPEIDVRPNRLSSKKTPRD